VDGLKALQTLRHLLITDPKHLPDYILLDLSMPDMDDFEFLNEYKNLHIWKLCKK
jgi:CheY-like chemotaxis protein